MLSSLSHGHAMSDGAVAQQPLWSSTNALDLTALPSYSFRDIPTAGSRKLSSTATEFSRVQKEMDPGWWFVRGGEVSGVHNLFPKFGMRLKEFVRVLGTILQKRLDILCDVARLWREISSWLGDETVMLLLLPPNGPPLVWIEQVPIALVSAIIVSVICQ